MIRTRAIVAAAACAAGLLSGPAQARLVDETAQPQPQPASKVEAPSAQGLQGRKPLRGKVIVIDAGHQLGNARHPRQANRLVDAGGFRKACNTTGATTNGGFAEATFTWRVARALRAQLIRRGASVVMTRHTNSYDDWGPCIDVRGRTVNRVHADAAVSIHGDGASSAVHGFFVIMPAKGRGRTNDVVRSSNDLGHRVKAGLIRAGLPVSSSYGGDGLDRRGDLGTLNWSDKPIVMVEMGNMRNARDARHMTSPRFRRHVYARGLRIGLTRFVANH